MSNLILKIKAKKKQSPRGERGEERHFLSEERQRDVERNKKCSTLMQIRSVQKVSSWKTYGSQMALDFCSVRNRDGWRIKLVKWSWGQHHAPPLISVETLVSPGKRSRQVQRGRRKS
jgi:hypothetical protein